jgi:hypothetical protein
LKQGKILYEPLPVARIGVRKDNQEVIAANDYSCLAYLLEEYVCFGAVQIIMPRSSPEVKTLEQMPLLLRNRIQIIEDSNEIDTVNRLLFELRKEFNVKISEENNFLSFPKDTGKEIMNNIQIVHSDLKKLAIGFNHSIQIDINSKKLTQSLRFLRSKVHDSSSRLILAQLEALINQYETVDFSAIVLPKNNIPYELMTLFDQLINDKNYIEYSNCITELSLPNNRKSTLLRIEEIVRLIRSKNYIAEGWDYAAKILKVWTGIPFPESKAISTLVRDKNLPSLIEMDIARKRAVEIWKSSNLINQPLRRDGEPIINDQIHWVPPIESMEVYSPYDQFFSIGKVKDLLAVLKKIQEDELYFKK